MKEKINPLFNTFLIQPRNKTAFPLILSLAAPRKPPFSAGRPFVLAEILLPEPSLKHQLQTIFNQIMRHYEEENNFEKTMEWGNQLINQTIDAEIKSRLNCLIGCLKENHLDFAATGQMSAYLIFKDKENYRLLDLAKTYGNQLPNGEVPPARLNSETKQARLALERAGEKPFFSSLISGDLKHDNFLIFCTASVFDFLTPDRLKKILLSRPPDEAAFYLEKTLSQIGPTVSFGGLIVNYGSKSKNAVPLLSSPSKLTPDSSIRRMVRKERETEKILSPSLWLNFREIFEMLARKLSFKKDLKKNDLVTIKKIAKIYNRLTGWHGRAKKLLLRACADWPKTLCRKNARERCSAVWQNFRALPRRKRLIISAICALLTLFIVSVGVSAYQNRRDAEQQKYNQLVNSIKEKIDAAETKIIYQKENEARAILKQARENLVDFPQNSKNRRYMRGQLLSAMEALASKLRHLEIISPQLEVDLTAFIPETRPSNLIQSGSDLFLFADGDKDLLRYSVKTGKMTPHASPILRELKDGALSDNNELFLLNSRRELIRFDGKTRDFGSIEIVWPREDSKIQLISFYHTRLYSLDVKNQRISKHSPTALGFSKGETWQRENLKLDDVSDITIDGAIYLAKNNGEIWKLENGRRSAFDISALEPALSSPVRIYASTDSSYLFITEAATKRIVIWDKNRRLLKTQLTSDQFDDLRDFSVDEKNKTIYVLNGKKILSVKF